MEFTLLLGVLVALSLPAAIGAVLGDLKNQALGGMLMSALLGPIGWIAIALSSDPTRQPCPTCAEDIKKKAQVCPFCGAEVG